MMVFSLQTSSTAGQMSAWTGMREEEGRVEGEGRYVPSRSSDA